MSMSMSAPLRVTMTIVNERPFACDNDYWQAIRVTMIIGRQSCSVSNTFL